MTTTETDLCTGTVPVVIQLRVLFFSVLTGAHEKAYASAQKQTGLLSGLKRKDGIAGKGLLWYDCPCKEVLLLRISCHDNAAALFSRADGNRCIFPCKRAQGIFCCQERPNGTVSMVSVQVDGGTERRKVS